MVLIEGATRCVRVKWLIVGVNSGTNKPWKCKKSCSLVLGNTSHVVFSNVTRCVHVHVWDKNKQTDKQTHTETGVNSL